MKQFAARWTRIFVTTVPAAIVLAGGAVVTFRVLQYLTRPRNLAEIAEVEATRALGRTVLIQSLSFKVPPWRPGPNIMTIRGLWVGADRSNHLPALGSASVVSVTYATSDLFSSNLTLPLIRNIAVNSPHVTLVRGKSGLWNFSSLIHPSHGAGRPSIGSITITGGALHYIDYSLGPITTTPKSPLATDASLINAQVSFVPGGLVTFNGTCAAQHLSHHVSAVGEVMVNPLRIVINLNASSVSLPYAATTFIATRLATVSSGTANTTAHLLITAPQLPISGPLKVSVVATAKILNGTVHVPSLPGNLTRIAGIVSLAGPLASVDLKSNFAGAHCSVSGTASGIVFGRPINPEIQAEAELKNASWRGFYHDAGLNRITTGQSGYVVSNTAGANGTGNIHLYVIGTATAPTAWASANLFGVHWGNYAMPSVQLNVAYSHKHLLAQARGSFAGGLVDVRSTVDGTNHGAFQLEAHGTALHLSRIDAAIGIPVGGLANTDIAMRGRLGRTPSTTIRTEVSNLGYRTVHLKEVYARAAAVGRELIVRKLEVTDPLGVVQASGSVSLGRQHYNLFLTGDELQLSPLFALAQGLTRNGSAVHKSAAAVAAALAVRKSAHPPGTAAVTSGTLTAITGVGYLRAHLGGSYKQPVLTGLATAFNLHEGDVSFDRAAARFLIDKQQISIARGIVERFPGNIQFSGTVSNYAGTTPRFDVSAQAAHLDLADALHIAHVPLPATLDAGQDGSILGSLNTGVIHVTGTPTDWKLVHPLTATLTDGVVNGIPIQSAELTANLASDGTFNAVGLLAGAGGTIQADASYSSSRVLNAEASGTNLQLLQLLTAATGSTSQDFSGTVAFRGSARGPLNLLHTTLQLKATGVNYRQFALGDLAVRGSSDGKTVKIADASIAAPSSAKGAPPLVAVHNATVNLDTKAVSGTVAWNDITLTALRNLYLQLPYSSEQKGTSAAEFLSRPQTVLAGSISGTAAVSGTYMHPVADANLKGTGMQIGNVALDAINASGVISQNNLQMPSPDYGGPALKITSPLGIILARTANVQFGGKMDIDAGLYNLALPSIAAAVIANMAHPPVLPSITGTGDLLFTATGTTSRPIVTASANVTNFSYGGVKFDSITLSRAQADGTTLTADDIALTRSFTAPDGSRGVFDATAQGKAAFQWKPPFITKDSPINITASIPEQNLQDLSAFAPGLVIDTDGKLSGAASITNTLANPRVTGAISMSANKLLFGRQITVGKPAYLHTAIRNLHGTLSFDGDSLHVANGFTAETFVTSSKTQSQQAAPILVSGSLPIVQSPGQAAVPGISIRSASTVFNESPLPGMQGGAASGTADISLNVTGSLTRPQLNGDIGLTNAYLSPPASTGSGTGGALQVPLLTRVNLTLTLRKNVTVAASAFNGKVTGSLLLTGTRQRVNTANGTSTTLQTPLHLFGDLSITQGVLALPTARFVVKPPGTITLNYPISDPSEPGQAILGINLDLKAQTAMVLPNPNSFSGRKRYQVTVTARGPLTGNTIDTRTGNSRLALEFQTNPPDFAGDQKLLTAQLLNALGASTIQGLDKNPGQAISQQVTSIFANSVLPTLFDQPARELGFQELALTYDPIRQLSFTLSRQIVGPLYVTYDRTLGGSKVLSDIKVSLRINERLQLSFEKNEQNIDSLQLEGVYRF